MRCNQFSGSFHQEQEQRYQEEKGHCLHGKVIAQSNYKPA